ncbi:hypothetical protein GCM10023188_40760 [Pontibacter saemangeumensis]|uniref:DUF4142 domain-containing protein n=1 Tax=Pontibacter saemangeumensis TaxID=1084525 RepID=A0ABP8M1L6_9BACT
MKKMTIAAACLVGMLGFTSCDSGTGEQQATEANGTPTVAGVDSTLTEDKQELLAFAARNNMLQIELGKIAAQKAGVDTLKQYGQQLVDWYSDKQQELQELAQQYSVTLPQQMEEEQLEHVEEVRNTKAEEFDAEYLESLANAQQEAIKEYDENLKDLEEADASAFSLWARNTQKELQAQMEQAKALELRLKSEDGGISNSL